MAISIDVLEHAVRQQVKISGEYTKTIENLIRANKSLTAEQEAEIILTKKRNAAGVDTTKEFKKLKDAVGDSTGNFLGLGKAVSLSHIGFKELAASSNTSAKFLAEKFPSIVAEGLDHFIKNTGATVTSLHDVMKLQRLGESTQHLVQALNTGSKDTKKLYERMARDLKSTNMDLKKFGATLGLSSKDIETFAKHTERLVDANASKDQRWYSYKKVNDILMNNHQQLAKVVGEAVVQIGNATHTALANQNTYKNAVLDQLEKQGHVGKIIAEHARPDGGGIGGALGALKKSIPGLIVGVLFAAGKRMVEETMDMAETGMKTGVASFTDVAFQLRLTGKQLQEVTAANKQALGAAQGGYQEFNEIMKKNTPEMMKLTGYNAEVTAKLVAQSQTQLRSLSNTTLSLNEMNKGIEEMMSSSKQLRNTFGMTADEVVNMRQRIIEDEGIRRQMVGLSNKERKEMILGIEQRVKEYGAMGMSRDKAEELAKAMAKASGHKDVKDIMKESIKLQQFAMNIGKFDSRRAGRLAELNMRMESNSATKEEIGELADLRKELGIAAGKYQESLRGQSTSVGLVMHNVYEKQFQWLNNNKDIIESASTLKTQTGGLAQRGRGETDVGQGETAEAAGKSNAIIMGVGEKALEARNLSNTLQKNMIGTLEQHSLLLGGILLALTTKGVAEKMGSMTDILKKEGFKGGLKTIGEGSLTKGLMRTGVGALGVGGALAGAGMMGYEGANWALDNTKLGRETRKGVSEWAMSFADRDMDQKMAEADKKSVADLIKSKTDAGLPLSPYLVSKAKEYGLPIPTQAKLRPETIPPMDVNSTAKVNTVVPTVSKSPSDIAAEKRAAEQKKAQEEATKNQAETSQDRHEEAKTLQEKSHDISKMTYEQMVAMNKKLDDVAKLLEISNDEYLMTEQQKAERLKKQSMINKPR